MQITQTALDMPRDNINATLDPRRLSPKEIFCSLLAVTNGALYFYVSAAGTDNLRKLFHLEKESPEIDLMIYGFGIGASVCFASFSYLMLENISLRPKTVLSVGLAILSPIAASSFLTAGEEGAAFMGINKNAALGFGIFLYLFRMISMIDGVVKFSAKKDELIEQFLEVVHEKDIKNLVRVLITLYTALGFTVSATDSIYAAIALLVEKVHGDPVVGFSIPIAIISAVGALAIFPLIYNWTLRGLNQLTYGGKPDAAGVVKDITDKYTFIAIFAVLPVVLGSLGSVTASSGNMFSKLGVASDVIRVSSSIIYAICGGIPGLSTLTRAVPRVLSQCKCTFFVKSNSPQQTNLLDASKRLSLNGGE